MDDADRTQQINEVYQDAAMRSHQAKRATACEFRGTRISKYVSRLCAGCGKRIPAARIKVKPDAALCIKCQTIHERKGDTE